MLQTIINLPMWQLIRSIGIVSYLFLAIGICLGIFYSMPVLPIAWKKHMYKLHNIFTLAGTGIGLLHGIITVIDAYMPYTWSEVLIPFTSKQHPVLNGFGTLAGYFMLLVIFTTDLRNMLKKPVWFVLHLMAYPSFFMAFIHGYYLGTDTNNPVVHTMYLVTIAAVLGVSVIRGFVRGKVSKPKSPIVRSLK
ncbi:ferric reductase [Paenibacillus planticolens]|uniref:Ferric reductase n=1 Tax=Paenibacillus planticolens TaxID=2654976 RepID=A0ABX1ZQX2_9BACL|nr:ferric reductase [Paenibacillus planticolens]NOV02331.1 ferric reductase [Paenibacillus planticolens]